MSPDYRMAALLGFPLTNSSANPSKINHAGALDFSGGGGECRKHAAKGWLRLGGEFMNKLLLCLFALTAFHAQAKAIDPVEACQMECGRKYNECLAQNAAKPIELAKCEARRVRCICDCSKKYEQSGGAGGEIKLPYDRSE